MEKEQVDKKVFCPNLEEEYTKIYWKEWTMNCPWCSIPMSQCDYWIFRSRDKENLRDDWRDSLLGRLK